MCPWKCMLKTMLADKLIRLQIEDLRIFDEWVFKSTRYLLISHVIQWRDGFGRRNRSREDIPFCWARWNCWGKSTGGWRKSGIVNCIPCYPICPQFWCSREKEWSAFGKPLSRWAAKSIPRLSHFWTQMMKARIRLLTWLVVERE